MNTILTKPSLFLPLLLIEFFPSTFAFMLTDVGCGHVYHSRSAAFFPPSYVTPNYSQSEEKCKWRITATPDERIILNITDLDIEKSVDCHLGYIEVRDGYWNHSSLLGRYCGEGQLDLVESTSNKMLVSYVVKNPKGHRGFLAIYEAVCGEELFIQRETLLESPYYPEKYPLNKKCIWKIKVPENREIVLRFQTFDLESQTNCLYDYVEIKNGLTLDLIGRYCGQNLPTDIISGTNSLLVKFVSDASIRNNGFSAVILVEYDECAIKDHQCEQQCINTMGGYRCACRTGFELQTNGKGCEPVCGGILNTPNGTIASPSFPDVYPPNKTCTWEIITKPFHIISLNFTDFELEEENFNHPKGISCDKDRVEVFNMLDENSTELQGIYCGNEVPDIISSKSSRVRIVFTSDSTVERSGFYLDFATYLDRCSINNGNCLHECRNTADSNTCVCAPDFVLQSNGRDCKKDYCNYEISSFSGIISSPGYPQNYPSRQNCSWKFTTTPGHRFNISFVSFHLEDGSSCGYDRVIIRDGLLPSSATLATLCGPNTPNLIGSSKNELSMIFNSDHSNEFKGFQAHYSVICGGRLPTDVKEKFIFSHANFGTADYDNETDCEWIITAAVGYNTTLSFAIFEIEDSTDCEYDYVEILKGVNSNAPSLGKFCGTSVPDVFLSSEGFLIRFHTDRTASNTGFSLVYMGTTGSSVIAYK